MGRGGFFEGVRAVLPECAAKSHSGYAYFSFRAPVERSVAVKVVLVRAFQVADLLATVIFGGMPGQAGHVCFLCDGTHDGGGEFVSYGPIWTATPRDVIYTSPISFEYYSKMSLRI
jgi:hypothetical protein